MLQVPAGNFAVAIVERRDIEFDLPAVHQALQWSPQAAQAFGLPPLKPRVVHCKPADGLLEVVYGEQNAPRVFMLCAEALGAILIAYCNRAGLPIPRAADKAIRIEAQHVVLVFTLRAFDAPAPESTELGITRVPDAVRAWAWMEAGT